MTVTELRLLTIVLLLTASRVPVLAAQGIQVCEPSLAEAFLDVGNVRARVFNNGAIGWRQDASPVRYEVPKDGGVNAIFAAGFWLGGTVDGQLRVAGSTYGPFEFWSGPLSEDGSRPTDCARWDRVWSVSREDIEVFDRQGLSTPDLQDWPTGIGAPTLDATGRPIDLSGLPLAARIDRKLDLAAGERPDITGDRCCGGS